MQAAPTKRRPGRPRKPIPQTVASEILEWLYNGGALRAYCRKPGTPKKSAIYAWCERDAEFDGRFTRARIAGATDKVEQALEIAMRATPENVQVAKLQVETLLKQAACFAPQLYGAKVERIEHDHSVRITLDTGVTPSALEHAPRLTVEPAQLPQPPQDSAPE